MSLWLRSIQSGLDGLPYSWAWMMKVEENSACSRKKKLIRNGNHDGFLVIFMPCSRDVAHIFWETLPDPFSWTRFLKKARALSSDLASNVEVIRKASTRVDRIAWRAKRRSSGRLSLLQKEGSGEGSFSVRALSPFFHWNLCLQGTHASSFSLYKYKGVLCRNPGSLSNNQNGGTLSWMNCFESDLKIIPQTPSLSEKSNGYLTDNDHSLWLTTPNLR